MHILYIWPLWCFLDPSCMYNQLYLLEGAGFSVVLVSLFLDWFWSLCIIMLNLYVVTFVFVQTHFLNSAISMIKVSK